MIKKISTYFITLTLIASCAPKSGSKNPLEVLTGYIFSTRQQTNTTFVGMVQLKTPALLAAAKIVDGKAIIDEELKAQIDQEQEEFIAKLESLSSDVKIINRYRLVLNAVAFTIPSSVADKVSSIDGVLKIVSNTNFARPKLLSTTAKMAALTKDLNTHTSVQFINADKLHKMGISGQNMRVGVIDTGIDYTHKMFGGPGTVEAYKSVDPNGKSEFFPNAKVVGGVDFVGTNYNSSLENIEAQIPVRDENPLDEAEHGTHVSGTVAGIGDGVNTYSGVAPDALLYALKVFGKEGSTSEIAVISALEYAADTSETLNPKNHLDVVNLSLGGSYGKPKVLYSEAVKNLTRAGTVVVASAGNSGDEPYIVGAPSTADDAISIAASIDDLDQNILTHSIEFKFLDQKRNVDLVEGTISIPAHDSNVSGDLIYIGNGATPLSDDLKAKVAGRIALVDRGAISFVDKIKLVVDLKAIGMIVVNNQDGPAFPMGGDGSYDIPAAMITKALGEEIKVALSKTNVNLNFSSPDDIRHVEKIDQITDFSSRGPRTLDSLIKPEIAAPGSNIISAHSGTGFEGVQFSGTSMAAPHMTGVMTLLKQAFPTLSVAELKAKVMNTSKILMKDNAYVPVSLQGAGRVDVFSAFNSKLIAMPASLSLGEISLAGTKGVSKNITLKNISDKDIVVTTKVLKGKNASVSIPASFRVKAHSSMQVNASFKFTRSAIDPNNQETDGFVLFNFDDGSTIHLPFLAVLNKVSEIKASEFVTQTDTKADRFNAEVKLKLTNNGKNDGDALIFNLLGTDERKINSNPMNLGLNNNCDLEAAGIRIVERNIAGQTLKLLQVGVKLYDTLTFWQPCDISLQIDSNNDGVADYELVGTRANYIAGITAKQIASVLLDAKAAREIRKAHEGDLSLPEDYTSAVLDAQNMYFYDHGSVAVIETDISKLADVKTKAVGIKLAVSNLESDNQSDDFLASHENKWQKLSLMEDAFAYKEIPELISVKASDVENVSLKRGLGNQRLLILYPYNMPNGILNHDLEAQILTEKLLK